MLKCCFITDIWIRNSELICGTLDKSVIGGGSKKNIFYLILKEYKPSDSIDTMLRLCRVSSFYISMLLTYVNYN